MKAKLAAELGPKLGLADGKKAWDVYMIYEIRREMGPAAGAVDAPARRRDGGAVAGRGEAARKSRRSQRGGQMRPS